MVLDTPRREADPQERPPPWAARMGPAWRFAAFVGLIALAIVVVVAAVDLASPGPPQVFMYTFPSAYMPCSGTPVHMDIFLDVELYNDGAPALVVLRATLDGQPALIDGVNQTASVYVPGPRGAGYAHIFVRAPDCNPVHTADAVVAAVLPA